MRFTKDHELLKFDDETRVGTISVTDYAQRSLGDVVFVELPAKGTTVKQGGNYLGLLTCIPLNSIYLDQIGAVESVKAASDIVAFLILFLRRTT